MTAKVKANTNNADFTYICLLVTICLCGLAMFAYAAEPPENILVNGDSPQDR